MRTVRLIHQSLLPITDMHAFDIAILCTRFVSTGHGALKSNATKEKSQLFGMFVGQYGNRKSVTSYGSPHGYPPIIPHLSISSFIKRI